MLGDNIRLLRSVRGISQVELGEKLNVSKQSISNWENGNIQPSIEMLMKLRISSPYQRIFCSGWTIEHP